MPNMILDDLGQSHCFARSQNHVSISMLKRPLQVSTVKPGSPMHKRSLTYGVDTHVATKAQTSLMTVDYDEEKPTSLRVKCSISILGHKKRGEWETFPALHWTYWTFDKVSQTRLVFLALRDSEPDAVEQRILFPVYPDKPRRRQAEIRVSFVLVRRRSLYKNVR